MTKQTGAVTDLLGRLLPLWTQPAGSRDDAEAAFREVYADPVVVNSTEMPIAELAGRARALRMGTSPVTGHMEWTCNLRCERLLMAMRPDFRRDWQE